MLEYALNEYIKDPENPLANYMCAKEYDKIKQSGSAVGFYLRAAERTDDKMLQYKCLIRMANCFTRQKNRTFTVKGLLQRAITILPERPEAYYHLSVMHEKQNRDGSWNECYTAACQGLLYSSVEPMQETYYPGEYMLLFQKAYSSYMCGYKNESKQLFLEIWQRHDLPDNTRELVKNNLIKLKGFETENIVQYKDDTNILKHPLPIQRNYSEAFQDLFVLYATNCKKQGTYLEIGGGDPVYGNNTYLLEKYFDWNGISIDFNAVLAEKHRAHRNHTVYNIDATICSYEQILQTLNTNFIDYLQVDCDPSEISYQVLQRIPFDKFDFGVITFEHDNYVKPTNLVREKSRKLLSERGYKLIVGNVSPDQYPRPFEDWYVHPSLYSNVVKYKSTGVDYVQAPSLFLR